MKCFGQRNRNYHCKIVLLDNLELIQEIQKSTLAQELLNNIFKHLNLIETAYFGLRFVKNGQPHWLEKGKRVIPQLKGLETITLYFGVKYYVADPCKLVEEITRYQFFLQIKQDILHGRLFSIPQDIVTELFACAVQAEVGDYDRRLHSAGYVSEFHFLPDQSTYLEARIEEAHQTMMIGLTPAMAELNFLDKVKWLEMYGVDLHAVLGENSTDYFLGLSPSGIIVLRNKLKVASYLWPRIEKITRKGRYFMLRVRNKKNEEEMFGFETPTKLACKHLWKCAVEQQGFFRLLQLTPASKSEQKVISGPRSRFRDSLRSDISVNRRSEPQFARTPSKRFQRRGAAGADSVTLPPPATNRFQDTGARINCDSMVGNSADLRVSASTPLPLNSFEVSSKLDFDTSIVSADFESVSRGMMRLDQMRRSRSAESNCNSTYSHSRRRHHERGRSSDNDSIISTKSSRSQGKRRRHKSGTSSIRRESESESESGHQHQRRRHRHKEKYEFIDSDVQWQQAQLKKNQPIQQDANGVNGPSQSGQTPSSTQNQTQNENFSREDSFPKQSQFEYQPAKEELSFHQQWKKPAHSRRAAGDKSLPEEVKRHLSFDLIDTEGMTEEQLRHIPYQCVETDRNRAQLRLESSARNSKLSTYSEHARTSELRAENHGTQNGYRQSPPPSYSDTILREPASSTAKADAINKNMPLEFVTGQMNNASQAQALRRSGLSEMLTPLLPVGNNLSKQSNHGGQSHQVYVFGANADRNSIGDSNNRRHQWPQRRTEDPMSSAQEAHIRRYLGAGPVPVPGPSLEMSTEL